MSGNLDHIDDPIQANWKARIYAAAEEVIERFDLNSAPGVALTGGNLAELPGAIAKVPGYARLRRSLLYRYPSRARRRFWSGSVRDARSAAHDGAVEAHFRSS